MRKMICLTALIVLLSGGCASGGRSRPSADAADSSAQTEEEAPVWVEHTTFFSYLDKASESPDGRYTAFYKQTEIRGRSQRPCAIYLVDAETNREMLVYETVLGYRDEPLALTNTLMYNCFQNEFYDLQTGKRLPLRLELPQAPDFGGVVNHFILGLVESAELERFIAVRPALQYGLNNPIVIEQYDLDGGFLSTVETEFYFHTYVWESPQLSTIQPYEHRLEAYGNRLLFTDVGYREDADAQRLDRIVDMDLSDASCRYYEGAVWSRSGDIIVTVEYQGDTLTAYKYVDGTLLATGSAAWIELEKNVHNYQKHMLVAYDPRLDYITVVAKHKQDAPVTIHF